MAEYHRSDMIAASPSGYCPGCLHSLATRLISDVITEVLDSKFLAVGEEWISYASTPSLIAALRSQSLPYHNDELSNHIHQRLVKPVSDLFPLLLALPILFIYKASNPYKRGGFAALIAALYVGTCYFINFTCRTALPPSLCAFLPMILFLPAVLILFKELDRC